MDVGNLVVGEDRGAATLLTTVVSREPMYAFVSAPERQFLKYVRLAARGDRPSSRDVRNPALLKLADEDDYGHLGAIDFVDNALDDGTDTMTGRLVFPNEDGLLTPGLFARVRVLGSGVYEALLIPDAAVTMEQNRTYVLLAVPASEADPPPGAAAPGPPARRPRGAGGMTVARRAVTLGPLLGGLRVVREGLSPDDLVVTRGVQAARPGSPVTVEEGEIELDEAAFERDVRMDLARETLGVADTGSY